jgi:hypothetical protein
LIYFPKLKLLRGDNSRRLRLRLPELRMELPLDNLERFNELLLYSPVFSEYLELLLAADRLRLSIDSVSANPSRARFFSEVLWRG